MKLTKGEKILLREIETTYSIDSSDKNMLLGKIWERLKKLYMEKLDFDIFVRWEHLNIIIKNGYSDIHSDNFKNFLTLFLYGVNKKYILNVI